MFCPNCGKEMKDGAIFCNNCGYERKDGMKKISNKNVKRIIIVALSIVIVVMFAKFIFSYLEQKRFYSNFSGFTTAASGDIYYYKDGEKIKNDWLEYDGEYYYFDENGKVLRNTYTPDGYYVGSDGKYINGINDLSSKLKQIKLVTEYSKDTLVYDMDTVKFGSYPQSDVTGNKKEPIEWIVLDRQDGKALLLSKYILDYKSYDTSTDFFSDINIWEKCSLRSWLNSDFYNNAFKSEEKEKIIKTYLINNNNIDYGINGGNNTEDNVFCLSIEEIRKYFGDGFRTTLADTICYQLDKNVSTSGTNYAKAIDNNGQRLPVFDGNDWFNGYSDYWLRSPGCDNTTSAFIEKSGYIFYINYSYVYDGVRPAIWVEY